MLKLAFSHDPDSNEPYPGEPSHTHRTSRYAANLSLSTADLHIHA